MSDALSGVETQDFNVLVTDSVDTSIHATIQVYVDRLIREGKRIQAVIAEPTAVAFDTRMTNAKAANYYALTYVGNGFIQDGLTIEGYKAAAYIAGRMAGSKVTESLTHDVVERATDIVGALTNSQIEKAINSGMMVFTFNSLKQIQVEYDINTQVTLSADQDAGWKKNRRVKTRFNLIDRIVANWEPLIGKVNNDADGNATLIAAGQAVINSMITEGALAGGTITLDPGNPPAGDSAWFLVENVVDNDSAEKMYLSIGFQYGAQ
jgi:hypothetical protein